MLTQRQVKKHAVLATFGICVSGFILLVLEKVEYERRKVSNVEDPDGNFGQDYETEEHDKSLALTLRQQTTTPETFRQGNALPPDFDAERNENDVNNYMEPTLVPNTFYYIWCGQKTFTFFHYLGVLSAIRMMNPEVILFQYQHWPKSDGHNWFRQLLTEYPFRVIPVSIAHVRHSCMPASDPRPRPRFSYIMRAMNETGTGGVYLSEETILTQTISLDQHLEIRFSQEKERGYIVISPQNLNVSLVVFIWDAAIVECPYVKLYYGESDGEVPEDVTKKITNSSCLQIEGNLSPADFESRKDVIGDIARGILSGSKQIDYTELSEIPNIAHVLWVGRKNLEMDFLSYLSIVSLVYVQEVEIVYIHGDEPPTGELWRRLRKMHQVNYRHRYTAEWSKDSKKSWDTLMARDRVKIDILMRWGGIFMDEHSLVVRKINVDWMKYEMVGHDTFTCSRPQREALLTGFSLFKPGSDLLEQLYEAQFKNSNATTMEWKTISSRVSDKYIQQHPGSVHVDPHLEVVCTSQCHPTWTNSTTGTQFDWESSAYVYRFCKESLPKSLMSETALERTPENDMFAQMARHVLYRAGLFPKI